MAKPTKVLRQYALPGLTSLVWPVVLTGDSPQTDFGHAAVSARHEGDRFGRFGRFGRSAGRARITSA